MTNIFISYNRKSEAIAKGLAEDFEALGHSAWLDQELSGGRAWWDQILSMVRRCDLFVFVLDPESLNSTACKREYGYATEVAKPARPKYKPLPATPSPWPVLLITVTFVPPAITPTPVAAFVPIE